MLDVMPELMRDDVCLGELAGRAETLAKVVVESEIDVDLLIVRTIEWSDRRLADAARRLRRVAIHDERRVAETRHDPAPCRVLDVVHGPIDELRQTLFASTLRDRADLATGALRRTGARGA